MKNNEYKKFAFSSEKGISRRQFIKDVGVFAGGLTIASMLGACNGTEPTKTNTTASNPTTVTSKTPTTSITTTTDITSVTNTGTKTTTTTSGKQHIYQVPAGYNPETLPIPGCTTNVALDRLYSYYHIWVQKLEGNKVLIGITEKCVLLIGIVDTLNAYMLPSVGSRIEKDTPFGYMDGKKMTVEFISPVSGKVLDVHDEAFYLEYQVLTGANYTQGWLMLVELDDLHDLDDLLNPYQYGKYQIPATYKPGTEPNDELFLNA